MQSPLGPLTSAERREIAFQRRVATASVYRTTPVPDQRNNGDDQRYPNKIASFTKGLPHQDNGEVDIMAYEALIDALSSGDPQVFERIPLGGGTNARKFVNPQAGLAFDTEGADSHLLAIPPAPRFESAEEAAEIVENYWMALLRDIPFDEYANHPLAQAAATELSTLQNFKGAKQKGKVTPQTLFRDRLPGVLNGPYLSQFLLKPVPFGVQGYKQLMRTILPHKDFMTDFAEWLAVQRGQPRDFAASDFDPTPVYIRNGRDLSQWVHIDVLFQAYFNACLILLASPNSPSIVGGGIGGKFDANNPYLSSLTQDGFGTFGGPFYIGLLTEVATRALKAVWFQKWFVHRRLRPEAFGGRIHAVKTNMADYPVHPQALNSDAVSKVFHKNNTYLLPQAFPEGSPTHPAYGAGHATVAGACVTILKALFDEEMAIPDPVQVDLATNGTKLKKYEGEDRNRLTVGSELNKLASNVATGRNIAGVHWRSDGIESLFLGEQVAISVLRDYKLTYNETFEGWNLTTFSGQKIVV